MKKQKDIIIKINHLCYTVKVKDIRNLPKEYEYFMSQGYGKVALCVDEDKNNSAIYIKMPITKNNFSTLAHEATHVLQNICKSRGVDFNEEKEHTAYIMHLIINTVLGYEGH